MREKKHEIKQKVLHSLKVNYEKFIEVNNELKVNVGEQKNYIKQFKEQCDIDYEAGV